MSWKSLSLTALALALATAANARADAILGDFNQTVMVSSTMLVVDPPAPTASSSAVTMGDVTVNFTGQNQSNLNASGPGTDAILGNVTVTKADVGTTPISVNYDFNVGVGDMSGASLATKSLDVTGTLTGTITKTADGALSLNLQNTYTSPTAVVLIGNMQYTVTPQGFFAPGPGSPGLFGAHITAIVNPNPIPAPEPVSAALWGAGTLAAMILRRRFGRVRV
jgi:hypothetical protein